MKVEGDKAEWGPGEWQDEPDYIEWIDPATRLPCIMRRNLSMGHWLGYVCLPHGHRARHLAFNSTHELDKWASEGDMFARLRRRSGRAAYDNFPDLQCHGGLTYAGSIEWRGPEFRGLRAAGMDFAHLDDLVPGMRAIDLKIAGLKELLDLGRCADTYRNAAYVRAEVEALAVQINAIGDKRSRGRQ